MRGVWRTTATGRNELDIVREGSERKVGKETTENKTTVTMANLTLTTARPRREEHYICCTQRCSLVLVNSETLSDDPFLHARCYTEPLSQLVTRLRTSVFGYVVRILTHFIHATRQLSQLALYFVIL